MACLSIFAFASKSRTVCVFALGVSLGSSSEGATRAPLTPTGVRQIRGDPPQRVGCVSLCFVLRSVGSSASVQLSARNELPLRTFWSMKSPRVTWRAFGNVFG